MKKILESLDDVAEVAHDFVDCRDFYGVPDTVSLILSCGNPEIVEFNKKQWIAIKLMSKNSGFKRVTESDGEWTKTKEVWHEEPVSDVEIREVMKAFEKFKSTTLKTYPNADFINVPFSYMQPFKLRLLVSFKTDLVCAVRALIGKE